jgi:hypothetical protein
MTECPGRQTDIAVAELPYGLQALAALNGESQRQTDRRLMRMPSCYQLGMHARQGGNCQSATNIGPRCHYYPSVQTIAHHIAAQT